MKIRFWGVRGSLPTPILREQFQNRLLAIISQITPKDVLDEDSKMRFISSLPEWEQGIIGGNTSCVEIKTSSDDCILLDCGTGLRVFSQYGKQPKSMHYHIFLSHFHWDHIQGIPFFSQLFNPNVKVDIYSNFEDVELYLKNQSSLPYFPENACWDSIKDRFTFHILKEGEPFELLGLKVNSKRMKHPGGSYAFSFIEGDKKFIYSTDTELQASDFNTNLIENSFFKDANVLVLDSQYTNIDALQKENWGHSSFGTAIDFASLWNVKKLYLFHHEPCYDDKKLYSILNDGKSYIAYRENCNVELHLAQESQEIIL